MKLNQHRLVRLEELHKNSEIYLYPLPSTPSTQNMSDMGGMWETYGECGST